MKKSRIIGGVFFVAVIVFLIQRIIFPLYDEEEAKIARGDIYQLNDEWVLESDGEIKGKDVSFPLHWKDEEESQIALIHVVNANYSSLAINLHTENCAIRIFLDGKPIYEAGFISKGNNRYIDYRNDNRTDKEILMQMAVSTASEIVEAGEITADLPVISKNGKIRIELERVNKGKEMSVYRALISKRDVAVINVLKESMIPILCGVLILIFSVIFVTLDTLRMISGEKMRGHIVLALIGIDIVGFILLQSHLMHLFFANRTYFEKISEMNIVIMPVMFAFFYYLGYHKHFPKLTDAMLLINMALTIHILLLEITSTTLSLKLVKPSIGILLIEEAGFTLYILLKGKKKEEGYQAVIYDIFSMIFFLTAAFLTLNGDVYERSKAKKILIDVLLATGFLFLTIQHIRIMISRYKAKVELTNETLRKQVVIAEEAKAEAIAASEAKGNFLANMSHEIRTPINAVLGMDEMILRESREKTIRDYAMDIHTAGQSLLSIINDILDMSKIESGKMEIIPVEYDLSSLIHDLSNMISFRAKSKKLVLEVSVDEMLPAKVRGDDVRLKQVITNILTNAVKYTEKGTVWFRVYGKRDGKYEYIHFEVEDTGIGIKQEDMSKLFEAFQRIEEGRNRNIEGTGLGMSITMHLLEMMGSKLQVESVYGQGSKFFFDLKQEIIDDTPLGDFESRIKNLGIQYSYSRSFVAPEARILVVDDNVMNRKVFAALLKPTKINVEEAESGYDAVEMCAASHFDMIFMDHMMPGMDGIEAFHTIRENKDSPCINTPVIILTANAVAGAKEKYLKEGFDGFLSKPVVSEKLEAMIKNLLPENMMQEAPEDMEEDAEVKEKMPELPMIDGIDWEVAWLHLPSSELLQSAFAEFYNIIELHAGKLQNFYDNIQSDLDEYRIQVHGMKSSAAAVGIIPLAGMAKVLEFAAKEKDIETIRGLHDIFVKEWRSYRKKLTGLFGLGKEDDGPKETVDSNALRALFHSLREAMGDMDIDTADECMAELKKLALPEEVAKSLDTLQAQVSDLDSDGACETIEAMLSNV